MIIAAYVCTLLLFVGIDLVWLMGPGRPLYVAEIGSLLRSQPLMGPAFAFYALYAAGLTYFAVWPGVSNGSAVQALGTGALFGLMAYATYDLTNLAVVNGFTTRIALIDMAWGSVLSGLVAGAVVKGLSLVTSG
ncbi:MAG: DUF2177 family protein [Hyphomicrobiales bacterium]